MHKARSAPSCSIEHYFFCFNSFDWCRCLSQQRLAKSRSILYSLAIVALIDFLNVEFGPYSDYIHFILHCWSWYLDVRGLAKTNVFISCLLRIFDDAVIWVAANPSSTNWGPFAMTPLADHCVKKQILMIAYINTFDITNIENTLPPLQVLSNSNYTTCCWITNQIWIC